MAKRKLEEEDDEFILKNLQCSLCNKMLTLPKQLPECGHCFCRACLIDHCDNKSRSNSPLTTPVSGGKSEEKEDQVTLDCPYCYAPNNLGVRGVDGIPTNANLLALTHRMKKKSRHLPAKVLGIENQAPSSLLNGKPLVSDSDTDCFGFERLRCVSGTPGALLDFGRSQSVASITGESMHCCPNFDAQTGALCQHCDRNFCKRCEPAHVEFVRSEIVKLGAAVSGRMFGMPDAEALSSAANEVFNKMTLDLENFETDVADFVPKVYAQFSSSLQKNAERLLEEASEIVHKETERIGELVRKCSQEDGRIDVYNQIKRICTDMQNNSLFKLSLETVSSLFHSISAVDSEITSLENLCQPVSDDLQLQFSSSSDFMATLESLGNSLSIGSIVNLMNRPHQFQPSETVPLLIMPAQTPNKDAPSIDFDLPVKDEEKQLTPTSEIVSSTGVDEIFGTQLSPMSPSPPPQMPEISPSPSFDNGFYENLRVSTLINGLDHLEWILKYPRASCILNSKEEPVAAVLHNGTRISLINSTGAFTATYRVRYPPEIQENCYLGAFICGTEDGELYVTDFNENIILHLDLDKVTSPKNAFVKPFVRSSCGKFSGLAVSSLRQEVYTSSRDAILAYSTLDGSQQFEIPFESPYQIGSSLVRAALSNESGVTVFFTSGEGKTAHSLVFPASGPVTSSDVSFTRLPLSKHVRHVPKECSFLATSTSSVIQSMALDPAGNLLVLFTNLARIKVFSRDAEEPFAEFSPNPASKDLPLSFVVIPNNNLKPTVLLTYGVSNTMLVLGSSA